jgi:Flp pilus assembly protein TadB
MDWLKDKSPIQQLIILIVLLFLVLIVINLVVSIVKALIPILIVGAVIVGIYWFVTQYNKD